jgi:hypothetical protein
MKGFDVTRRDTEQDLLLVDLNKHQFVTKA